MLRFIARTLVFFAGSLLLVCVVAWLFLVLPFVSPQRAALAQKLLEADLGRPFAVHGDARLHIGETVRLVLTDVALPSPTAGAEDLATADVFELDLKLSNLIQNKFALDNLKLSGLILKVITSQDGVSNWAAASSPDKKSTGSSESSSDNTAGQDNAPEDDKPGVFDRTEIDVRNSSMRIENEVSGFTFDLGVDELVFQRPSEGRANIDAKGTLNGKPLMIKGGYNAQAPFSIAATIGETRVEFDGEPLQAEEGQELTARLTSEIEDIENLLEVLRLKGSLQGRATVSVDLGVAGGTFSAEQFDLVLDTANGQEIKASGSVASLVGLDGIEATVDASLFPEGKEPPRAATIQDIKVTGASIALEGSLDDLVIKSVLVSTNAFDQGFDRLGQVSISQLHRSPEGLLEIERIVLQAGPPNAPYMRAEGQIGDVLHLEDIGINGTLNVPSNAILLRLGEGNSDQFGVIDGSFDITVNSDGISIEQFSAKVTDTDLWAFDTDVTMEQAGTFEGFVAKSEIGISDTSRFLTALGLAPVIGETLNLNIGVRGGNKSVDTKMAVTTGSTQADVTLNLAIQDTGVVARGGLTSERVVVSDLKNAASFFIQLSKQEKAAPDGREIQPLVLSSQPEEQPPAEAEARMVQPLVLPKEDLSSAKQQFFTIDNIATRSDVDFGINIEQVVGADDVSQINSDLNVRDGKLSFGPLNIVHGGGYFNLSAAMDVVKAPGVVSINGSTGGWDLGKIMSSMGAGIGAQGVLAGTFSLSGSTASTQSFIETMVGKADISMGRGRIDTSLLDLAGMGVIPWLFSKDLRQGYATVVCINAPLRIDRGRISTDKSVFETEEVQLVAEGTVDLLNDSVSLRAEPRPVGRPLARSAVPVEVSGKLSDPTVDLQLRGERGARSNGARTTAANREPCTPDIYQLR